MQLTSRTLTVLKNFSLINPNVYFKPGNVLRTVTTNKTIYAKAEVDTDIDAEFGIYDLPRFLSALSLFTTPSIDVDDRTITIKGDKKRCTYIAGKKELLFLPPDNDLTMPAPEIQFTLTNDSLQDMLKGLAILGLPQVAIIGDGTTLSVQGVDVKGVVKDGYSIDIGDTDRKFKLIFELDNLKLLPMDYNVSIARKGQVGISQFTGSEFGLTYWIAVEKDSVYE